MPTETAIVVAGIVLVFAVFAVTLAWADFYTRNYPRAGREYRMSSHRRGARSRRVGAPARIRHGRTNA